MGRRRGVGGWTEKRAGFEAEAGWRRWGCNSPSSDVSRSWGTPSGVVETPREERNEKRWMKDGAWERTRKAKKVHELEGLEARWKEEAKVSGIEPIIS